MYLQYIKRFLEKTYGTLNRTKTFFLLVLYFYSQNSANVHTFAIAVTNLFTDRYINTWWKVFPRPHFVDDTHSDPQGKKGYPS